MPANRMKAPTGSLEVERQRQQQRDRQRRPDARAARRRACRACTPTAASSRFCGLRTAPKPSSSVGGDRRASLTTPQGPTGRRTPSQLRERVRDDRRPPPRPTTASRTVRPLPEQPRDASGKKTAVASGVADRRQQQDVADQQRHHRSRRRPVRLGVLLGGASRELDVRLHRRCAPGTPRASAMISRSTITRARTAARSRPPSAGIAWRPRRIAIRSRASRMQPEPDREPRERSASPAEVRRHGSAEPDRRPCHARRARRRGSVWNSSPGLTKLRPAVALQRWPATAGVAVHLLERSRSPASRSRVGDRRAARRCRASWSARRR